LCRTVLYLRTDVLHTTLSSCYRLPCCRVGGVQNFNIGLHAVAPWSCPPLALEPSPVSTRHSGKPRTWPWPCPIFTGCHKQKGGVPQGPIGAIESEQVAFSLYRPSHIHTRPRENRAPTQSLDTEHQIKNIHGYQLQSLIYLCSDPQKRPSPSFSKY